MATFDLLMAADPRFVGGTAGAIADELRCLQGSGLRVGLLPLEFAAFEPDRAVHPAIERVVADGLETWAGDGDEATLVAVHNPMVVDQPRPGFGVKVRAGACAIVAHQPPLDGRGVPWYLAGRSEATCRRYFGVDPVWAPISPVCRQALVASGMDVDLLDEDWTNVVFVDDWGTARKGPVCARPTIGRVSRDARDKWPASRDVLFAAYPPDGPVAEVGGGAVYGLGMYGRPMGESWVWWHLGLLCMPGRVEAASFALVMRDGWSVAMAVDSCPGFEAMGTLDRALWEAFGAD